MDVESLYLRQRPYVMRVSMSFCRNRFDADDICQNVFLAALKKNPDRNDKAMQAWLYRAARFEFLKVYEKKKRFVSIEDVPEMPIDHDFHTRFDFPAAATERKRKEAIRFVAHLCRELIATYSFTER